MASNIPITPGSGAASVATEQIGNNQYQIIKVVGAETGSTSTLGITPDGSAKVSVVGTVTVTGTIGASVLGHAPVVIVGGSIATSSTANQSVSGTVGASIIGAPPANVFVGGAVASAANPLPVSPPASGFLVTNPANSSTIAYVQNSVATVIIGGSIAATFTPPANQSVSGTVNIGTGGPVSVLGTLSVVGTVPVTQATNPWIITGSVQGTFSAPANQSVSGTAGASVIGWVPIQPSNTSTIAVLQAPSIVGTYAEDSAHATDSRGIFVMQVRNDTMSSMTSADGDYAPIAGGPVGETIVANSPITKWVQGTADLRTNSGGSVAVIAAQGASIFTYITGVQIANMGSASVLVTLSGATSSIVGYTIAPAGGGSNIVYPNALKTNANGAFTASISGQASVLVSAQGFIAKV